MSRAPILRASAAAFVLGPAVIHIAVAPAHLQAYLPYGLFFIAAGLFQAGLAAAVLSRPSPSVLLGGAVGTLFVIAIWVVSRTTGLPIGPTPGEPEPIGLPDLLATFMEWISVILLLVADIRVARQRRGHTLARVLGLLPAAVFSTVFTVVAVAAVAVSGTH